jgi:GNAT superfamily N-acetyltransferase
MKGGSVVLQVCPFEESHLGPAAELLASQYPSIAQVSEIKTARYLIDSWRRSCLSVAAVRDGDLVGFLAATLPKTLGEPLAKIRPEQHCATPDGRRDIYRSLYEALSGRLVAVGAFEHMITVSTAHADVLQHFFELGFGVDQIKGRRPLTRLTHPPQDVTVRPARVDDIGELTRLAGEVTLFHAEPPMLRPAFGNFGDIRDGYLSALDSDRQLLLIAEHDRRPVGLMQVGPDSRYRNTATIGLAGVTPSVRLRGVGAALLAGVVDWAERRGYEACGVEWTSPNPISDRFWRRHGFDPVHCKLVRRIDPQIAWANPHLSYEHFMPTD